MTQALPREIRAFVSGAQRLDPNVVVDCDPPDDAIHGSYWLDVRAGGKVLPVEWNARQGFGFAKDGAEAALYGTPCAHFVADAGDAVTHLAHCFLSAPFAPPIEATSSADAPERKSFLH